MKPRTFLSIFSFYFAYESVYSQNQIKEQYSLRYQCEDCVENWAKIRYILNYGYSAGMTEKHTVRAKRGVEYKRVYLDLVEPKKAITKKFQK